jgi:hypothetical protein
VDSDGQTVGLLAAAMNGMANRRNSSGRVAGEAWRTTDGVLKGCGDDCPVLRNHFIHSWWCAAANP